MDLDRRGALLLGGVTTVALLGNALHECTVGNARTALGLVGLTGATLGATGVAVAFGGRYSVAVSGVLLVVLTASFDVLTSTA